MACNLVYIPQYLHTDDKLPLSIFSVGEKLFYRCLPQNLERPYDKISLKDISHNRNFSDDNIFGSDCVMYNTDASKGFEKYEDFNFVTLCIKSLNDKETYYKELIKTNHEGEIFKVEMYLKHDPLPCMYPHSVFEIKLNDLIVTDDNYNQTIGRDNKFFSNIRSEIRQELTSIIQTGEIDSSNEIILIEEP